MRYGGVLPLGAWRKQSLQQIAATQKFGFCCCHSLRQSCLRFAACVTAAAAAAAVAIAVAVACTSASFHFHFKHAVNDAVAHFGQVIDISSNLTQILFYSIFFGRNGDGFTILF